MFYLNLLSFSLKTLPLVLSLQALEKSLAPDWGTSIYELNEVHASLLLKPVQILFDGIFSL